ncbi:MAG: hypothetical protein IJ298_08785 [Ruminococcus sp.]|nr:hypothetical protein [Ruminococcus sp.]
MSILEELYNGNITPCEMFVKKGSEYQKLSTQLTEYIDDLLPLLTKEERELYEKIEETISERSCISEREHFIQGFRLGAGLIRELEHYKSSNFRS